MNREEFKQLARAELARQAPSLAVGIAERLIEAPVMQRWFDRIEKKRPRGIVALVRRLRGKQRGLTEEQRAELEQLVEKTLEKYR
ncbi:MAG TPA: hypothetical protein VED01_03290 [Burkholderiales bacterium]|nr:hypothetical protein [Burkholderiales bacterium]